MRASDIKILAIVTMLIDHIGLFFFPHILIFRTIGRLAFPLFAWLVANGAHHTHNMNIYLRRLFLFALLSQIPFILANRQIDKTYWNLNVFFTLFLGLAAIKFIKENNNKLIWFIITVACAGAAYVVKTDYGIVGVISIVLFYLFFDRIKSMVISQIILYSTLPFVFILLNPHNNMITSYIDAIFELPGLFALFFIGLYNKQRGIKLQHLFYYIYPLQYLVIFFLKMLL